MTTKWRWLLLQLTRRLWFRAALISMLAVGAALISLVVSPYLPDGLSASIGARSVDSILTIIATSMLAVTTFSLSTAVTAFGAATSSVTPRATKLLIADTTTQNVLATFVGSFLFSLVGIVTLSTGAYGEKGRVVLFAVTLIVLALIVVTLLGWIDYLLRLGRVGETTQQVEAATLRAMKERHLAPTLGGSERQQGQPSTDMNPVYPAKLGYIQHIDMEALEEIALRAKGSVHLDALPGSFVDRNVAMAHLVGSNEQELLEAVAGAVTVAEERSFDQDPRFGLSVLAEIASRALSPAVNDPGTAIDVIGRATRLLSIWAEPAEKGELAFPNVHVPRLTMDDMFDDVFLPIERDGAAIAEVHTRLQKAFAILWRCADKHLEENAARHSRLALARAEEAMTFEDDIRRVRQAARSVANQEKPCRKTSNASTATRSG